MTRGLVSRLCRYICAASLCLPQNYSIYAAHAATPLNSQTNSDHSLNHIESFTLTGKVTTRLADGLEFKIALGVADDNAKSDVTVDCQSNGNDYVAQVKNVTSRCSSVIINTQLPLEITVPYDPSAIPLGNSEDDIRLFRLDAVAFNGPMSPLASFIDTKNKTTISTISEKTGIYINGILRPGEKPDQAPMLFSQSTLQSMETVAANTGKPLIAAPSANTDGDLRLSYPIEFPGARENFSPQVTVGYSAQSILGNIARGWNLNIPTISVETRWGVPEYDATFETETYLFNGEQLVPEAGDYFVDSQADQSPVRASTQSGAEDQKLAALNLVPMPHRTSRLRPRKTGFAHFVLRRDDGLWRFVRYGDGPANYWWEATQESPTGDRLKTLYFGRHPGRLEDELPASVANEFSQGTAEPISSLTIGPMTGNSNPAAISRWALAREIDSNKNIIDYDWVSSCRLDSGSACGKSETALAADRDLYLKRVVYTGHGDIEETILRCREVPDLEGCKRKQAEYEALFTWTDSSKLGDNLRRTDARSGGIVVSRRLLTQIDFRMRRLALSQDPTASDTPHFASYLGSSSWECSNSFRRYKFITSPDPIFEDSAGGLDNGAKPAWLSSVKMIVGRGDASVEEGDVQDNNIFPAGFDGSGSTCGQPPHFLKARNSTAEEEAAAHAEETRFTYHQPAQTDNKFQPFGGKSKLIDTGAVQSLSKADTGDRIKALRNLFSGLGTDKGPYTASALGSSLTEDTEAGFYFGIGLYVPQKAFSAGPKWTLSQRSKQEDLSMLLDVTGDGLPDLLVNEDGSWTAHPSEVTASGDVKFGSPIKLQLPRGFRFQHEPVLDVRNHGFEGHLFVAGTGNTEGSATTVQTTYLADMDGDGRADVVTPQGIFYNAYAAGISQDQGFQINSPYIRSLPAQPTPAKRQSIPAVVDLRDQYPKSWENPRYDAVRIWRAPFDGVIRVTGDAQTVARDDTPAVVWSDDSRIQSQMPLAHRDGVIVSIEKSHGTKVVQCAASALSPAVLDRIDSAGPFGTGTWHVYGSRVAQHQSDGTDVAYYRLILDGPRKNSTSTEKSWASRVRLNVDQSGAAFADEYFKALHRAIDSWNSANVKSGRFEFREEDHVLTFTGNAGGFDVPPLDVTLATRQQATHKVLLERVDQTGGPGAGADRVDTRFVPRLFSPGDPAQICGGSNNTTTEQIRTILSNASLPSGMLLEVNKDDVIYFRTHSIDNAIDDAVAWSPLVQYLSAFSRELPGPGNPNQTSVELFGTNTASPNDILEMAKSSSTLCATSEEPRLCDLFGRSILRYRPTATLPDQADNPGDIPILAQSNSGFVAPSTGVVRIQGALQKPKTPNIAHLQLVVIPRAVMDGKVESISGFADPTSGRYHPLSSRLKGCDPNVALPHLTITVEDNDKHTAQVTTRGWSLPLRAAGSPGTSPVYSMDTSPGTYSIYEAASEIAKEKKSDCGTRKMRRDNSAACGASLNELDVVQGDKVCLIVRDGENPDVISEFSPVDAAAYALVKAEPITLTYASFLDLKADGLLTNQDGTAVPPLDNDECYADGSISKDDADKNICIKGRDAYYTTPFVENGHVGVVSVSGTETVDPATGNATRVYYRSESPPRSTFKAQILAAAGGDAPQLACDWGDSTADQSKLLERRFVLDLGSFHSKEQYFDSSVDQTAYDSVQAVLDSRAIGYTDGTPHHLKLKRFAVFQRIDVTQPDGSTTSHREAREINANDLAGDSASSGGSKPDFVFDAVQPIDVARQELRFVRGSSGTIATSDFKEPDHSDPDGNHIGQELHRLASNLIGYSVCAPRDQDIVIESVLNEPNPLGENQAIDRLLGQTECSDLPPVNDPTNNPEDIGSTLPLERTRENICPLSRAAIRLAEVTGNDTFRISSLPLPLNFQTKTVEEFPAQGEDPLGVTHRRFDIEPIGSRQSSLAFIGHRPDQDPAATSDVKDPITHSEGDFPVDDTTRLATLPSLDEIVSNLAAIAQQAAALVGPLTRDLEAHENTSCPANPQTPAEKAACAMSQIRIPAFGINSNYRTAENPGAASSGTTTEPSTPAPVDQATLCAWLGRATFRRFDSTQLLDKKSVASDPQTVVARANWNLDEKKQTAAANAGGYAPYLCGMGPDQSLWFSGSVLSPSRLGAKDLHYGIESATYVDSNAPLPQPVTAPGRGVGIVPPPRSTRSRDSGGFNFAAVFGTTQSTNNATSSADAIDVNGDGYPDIVGGSGAVILTDPLGVDRCSDGSPWKVSSLCSLPKPSPLGVSVRLSHSETDTHGVSVSTNQKTALLQMANAAGSIGQNRSGDNNEQTQKPTQATYGWLGFSHNSGATVETRMRDLIDLNGDGLPDVFADGKELSINRGVDFVKVEKTAQSGIIGGVSRSSGLGISGGIASTYNDNSFEAGLAAGTSSGDLTKTVADINSDGLPDMLEVTDKGDLTARLNTGVSFSDPVNLGHLNGDNGDVKSFSFGRTESDRANAGGAYTYSWCIVCTPIIQVYLDLNPNVSIGAVLTRQTTLFKDIDGDGLPDIVFGDSLLDFLKNASFGISDKNVSFVANGMAQYGLLAGVFQAGNQSGKPNLEFSYSQSGRSGNDPSPRWVLAQSIVRDGVSADDGPDVTDNARKTCFTYQDGFFDRFERRFLGYGRIDEVQGCNEMAPPAFMVNDGQPNHSKGIRLIERHYANRTIYEAGLLLNETLFDISDSPDLRAATPEGISQIRQSQKRRELAQSYVLVDTALSTHERVICHKIRTQPSTDAALALLGMGFVRNVYGNVEPDACRDTFIANAGSAEPTFDMTPRRLTPFMVQAVRRTWEDSSENYLLTAMQADFDQFARVTRNCDLGEVGEKSPPRSWGATCSEISYADYVMPSFAHGATGGGRLIVFERNLVAKIEVVDYSRAANPNLTAAYDQQPDRLDRNPPIIRLRTASYDPETGQLVRSCLFVNPNISENDPCAGFHHFVQDGSLLRDMTAQDVAVRSFKYDQFGNLIGYVGPMGSGESFIAKSYRFDPYLSEIPISERTDYCNKAGLPDGPKEKSIECLGSHVAALPNLESTATLIDYRHAAAVLMRDINGNATLTPLDGLGRPTAAFVDWKGVVGPLCVESALCKRLSQLHLISDTATTIAEYAYSDLSSSSGTLSNTITKYSDKVIFPHVSSSTAFSALETKTLFDQLGNKIQTLSPGEPCRFAKLDDMSPNCATSVEFVRSPLEITDALGRPVRAGYQTDARIQNSKDSDAVLDFSKFHSEITYDGLDRPKMVVLPDGPSDQTKSESGNAYDFYYSIEPSSLPGLPARHRTYARDAACVPTAIDRDVRGLIRAVIESSNSTSVEGVTSAALSSLGSIDGSMTDQEQAAIRGGGLIDSVQTDLANHQQVVRCKQPRGEKFELASYKSEATYNYDALGQLVAVNLPARQNDPKAPPAAILTAYDGLGRRIVIDDPDRGFEKTSLDVLGNAACRYSGRRHGEIRPEDLIVDQSAILGGECTDPTVATPSHQRFDRIVQSTFLGGLPLDVNYRLSGGMLAGQSKAALRSVTYHYGQASDENRKTNRVGRPFQVDDAAGRTTQIFDELGRPVETDRSYDKLALFGPEADRPTIHTAQTFDVWGLLKNKHIWGDVAGKPIGGKPAPKSGFDESLFFQYTAAGQLLSEGSWSGPQKQTSPTEIISGMSYDERGNLIGVSYATGVKTRQDYAENSNRLILSRALLAGDISTATRGVLFQDLHYAYDASGNVIAYENSPSLENPCDPPTDPAACTTHPRVLGDIANARGLLIRSSNGRFAYDQLNRIRSSSKTLVSAFPASPIDYEGEPQVLTDQEIAKTTDMQLAFNETFAFDATHELALVKQSRELKNLAKAKTTTETGISRYVPDAEPFHAPRTIETKLLEQKRSRNTAFGYDAFGRMTADLCKHDKDPKACWPDQYFTWNADDTLAGQVTQIADARLPEAKKKQLKNVYYDDIQSEFDGAGQRIYKQLSQDTRQPGKPNPVATQFVSDTLYADPNLTIVRRPGEAPQAIVNYFVGNQRLASRWSGDGRIFTYHAQLQTQNVSDIVVGPPDHPESARIHGQQEYAAFGEVIHERETLLAGNIDGQPSRNKPGLPQYRFDGKELDEGGLQNFGSRFYSSRLSVWVRPDPILATYLDGRGNGGVFYPPNLASYGFGLGNPLNNVDTDGKQSTQANSPYIIDNGELSVGPASLSCDVNQGCSYNGPIFSKSTNDGDGFGGYVLGFGGRVSSNFKQFELAFPVVQISGSLNEQNKFNKFKISIGVKEREDFKIPFTKIDVNTENGVSMSWEHISKSITYDAKLSAKIGPLDAKLSAQTGLGRTDLLSEFLSQKAIELMSEIYRAGGNGEAAGAVKMIYGE